MICEDAERMPRRGTKGSCGYDIYLPQDVRLSRWKWTFIDLKVRMEEGDIPSWHFGMVVPRSSSGVKHGLRLRNTVGIIDSDYTMDTIKAMVKTDDWIPRTYKAGERVLQMIIVPYARIAGEIVPDKVRTGGHGSTGKN